MIENIVPIIIHLKHLLEEKHSPLLGPLMQYLTDMMKDYKNEISGTTSASFFFSLQWWLSTHALALAPYLCRIF